MAKLSVYLIVLIGTVMLFHFAGLISGTGNSYILDHMGVTNPETIQSSDYWTTIFRIASLAVAGIVIGALITKTSDTALLIIKVAVSGLFFLIGWDLYAIFNKLNEYLANFFGAAGAAQAFSVLIFSPLIILFVFTLLNWMSGLNT